MPVPAPNVLVITAPGRTAPAGSANEGAAATQATNLDRLARHGVRFTNWRPPAPGVTGAGWTDGPAVARRLRQWGYATGQFGLDVPGEGEAGLPTRHGFDEFFGASAGTTVRLPLGASAGKRQSVLHCWSDARGGERVFDRGAASAFSRPSLDQECVGAAIDFIVRQNLARRPFFAWFNAGLSGSPSGETPWHAEHDTTLGCFLDQLDHLDIATNTLVAYVGPHDPGGADGDRRALCLARWPARIPAGIVSRAPCCERDLLPTILAAAGIDSVVEVEPATQDWRPSPQGTNLLRFVAAPKLRRSKR